MATVTYFIRTKNTGVKEYGNIRIRLRHSDNYFYARTPYKILTEHWSKKAQKVKYKADASQIDEINSNLPKLETYLLNEYNIIPDKSGLSSKWLQSCVDQFFQPEKQDNIPVNLFEFIDSFIKKSKDRTNEKTGLKISNRTIQKYDTTLKVLKDFQKQYNRLIDFSTIDLDFYQDFKAYLTNDLKFATNTIGKYISTLKVFLNEAKEQGYIVYISKRFKGVSEESESIYLDENDLTKLYDHDFSKKPRLERVRDLFIVAAWTGLRFSDFTALKPQNFKNDRIEIKQYKTKGKVIIYLHPMAKRILEKYDWKLPISISNQKFNKYIKDVAKDAELKSTVAKSITKGGMTVSQNYEKWELVSSHTARRSFATNLYKSGFPAISIMAITGHKTEKAFLSYIRVTPEEHALKLREHWEKNTKLRIV